MELVQTKYEKLFSTPVLRFTLPDSGDLNAALLSAGGAMRARDDGVNKSNRGGWHSQGNLFEAEAECFGTLRDMARDAVLHATQKIGSRADLDALRMKIFAWMNMNPVGGYNAPHTHPGAHWSGVYYVSQPEVEQGNSGMIEFLDPRTDLPNWRMLKAPAFRLKTRFRPMPGDLILFPSYLVHWVYPNETDEERVTIAFNSTFKKPKRG